MALQATREQLQALRKSAPRNTKLTVSRPVRLKKQRSARLSDGAGNMPRYVARIMQDAGFPNEPANRSLYDYALRRANRYYETHGFAPSKTDLLG